jgi:hypothetical protein
MNPRPVAPVLLPAELAASGSPASALGFGSEPSRAPPPTVVCAGLLEHAASAPTPNSNAARHGNAARDGNAASRRATLLRTKGSCAVNARSVRCTAWRVSHTRRGPRNIKRMMSRASRCVEIRLSDVPRWPALTRDVHRMRDAQGQTSLALAPCAMQRTVALGALPEERARRGLFRCLGDEPPLLRNGVEEAGIEVCRRA